jgi:hypothetical protein
MQLVGVTKAEVNKSSLLWHVDGKDLVVWEYPVSQQIATQAKRKAGKEKGRGMDKSNNKDKSNSKGKGNSKDELSQSYELSNSSANSSAISVSFEIPTLEEVKEYASNIGYVINADAYLASRKKTGWRTSGGTLIRDWRADVVHAKAMQWYKKESSGMEIGDLVDESGNARLQNG